MPTIVTSDSATGFAPAPTWRKWMAAALALAIALAGAASATAAGARQVDYQLKAGYLYNFAKYIEWPPPPLASGANFRVGVLGDQAAFAVIAAALTGKLVGDNPIEVVYLDPEADSSRCRVVFVPRACPITPAQFRERPDVSRVLLVGERDGFAASGGEIGFVPRGDNLRYQVNLAAAQRAGLKLSARLSGLAEIVRPTEP